MLTHTCYLTLTKYSKVKKKKNINEVFLIISGIISISSTTLNIIKINLWALWELFYVVMPF